LKRANAKLMGRLLYLEALTDADWKRNERAHLDEWAKLTARPSLGPLLSELNEILQKSKHEV
jgi:hypothetical protein